MYAVIIRKYLPPREAGIRISFVLMATVLGMACGGLAFLHGVLWNCVNLALVVWLILWPRLRRRNQAVAT